MVDPTSASLPERGIAAPKATGTSNLPSTGVMDTTISPSSYAQDQAHQAIGTRPVADGTLDGKYLQLAKEAESQSRTYFTNTTKSGWERSLKAFRNEHQSGSKYLSKEWEGRSKIFRPKTRSAVRKDMATAAAALFSSRDVVSIGPGNTTDPTQVASAAIKKELLNYRLTRQNGRSAIMWFPISMGAVQDATIHGVCVSKQFWIHRTREADADAPDETVESVDDDGNAYSTTQPASDEVIIDRPEIQLYPPENVRIDPKAPWVNPVQDGDYVILLNPMSVDSVMTMMTANPFDKVPWRSDVTKEELQRRSSSTYDTESVRRAREGGRDRMNENQGTGTGHWNTIWVHENFIRCDGEDYHFYTVGTEMYLSAPTPVRKVYPEQKGERPITYGYGAIESHRITPMSKVESMQPLQMEANDVANLRLDQLKNVVFPVAKVKRGADVDIGALRVKSPNSTVLMKNPESDVIWDRPPDVPASAYQEQAYINTDLDDLTGVFSQGSVSTNRQLNQTVGGMNLLSGSANAMSEFDLRVWVETWVEKTLAQIVNLEEYFEADATVLALAGEKAQLFEKHGISTIDDHLMEQQVTTTVDVGIGAADPMQRMSKLKAGTDILGPILMPGIQSGEVKVQYQAFCDEIFGAIGYNDAKRFVIVNEQDPNAPPPPNPDAAKAQATAQAQVQGHQMRAQAHIQGKQIDAQTKQQTAMSDAQVQLELAKIQSATDIQIAKDKAQIEADTQYRIAMDTASLQSNQAMTQTAVNAASAEERHRVAMTHKSVADHLNAAVGLDRNARSAQAAQDRAALKSSEQ
jgi:hypothetical protein